MNNEAEAADLILRIVIDGTAYFFKLAGTLTKPVQELVVRALRRAWYEKGPGTVNPDMKALVQRGEGLNVFQIPEKDEETFRKAVAATGMGIKYVTVPSAEPLDAKDRMTMIICSSGDATVINGVLVQNRIHGRDVAKASKENPAPIEKPETPVEKVQQETPAAEGTTEKAQEQDEAFKAYYNVGKEHPDHAQEEPENPTQAADPMSGYPSANGSQTTAQGFTSEPFDIDAVNGSIEEMINSDKPAMRFSVKERIRKIRNDMAQETKAPATGAPVKSAVQESVENQLKEKIAGETRG